MQFILLKKAYKEDDGVKAIDGIEVLVLATAVLLLWNTLQIDSNFNLIHIHQQYHMYLQYTLFLKSIVIYTKGRKRSRKKV